MFSKKGSTVHKNLAAQKNNKALGTDRRDEMRSALRAKMSQKDYVDKSMKNYNYGKNSVSNGMIIQNGVTQQNNQQNYVQGGDACSNLNCGCTAHAKAIVATCSTRGRIVIS